MIKALKFFHIKNLILFFQGILFPALVGEEIRFEIARGAEIIPYIQDIIKISDAFYSHYPYLYDGTQSDEEFYMRLYARWPDARLVMAFDQEKAIGYAIGAPMKNIPVGQEPFVVNGYAIDSLFLLGEIALLEPYRERQAGKKMVYQMETFAKEELRCNKICIMIIDEDFVALPRPENYHSSEKFWHELGFESYRNLRFNIDWRNVNESRETEHTMFYRMKQL